MIVAAAIFHGSICDLLFKELGKSIQLVDLLHAVLNNEDPVVLSGAVPRRMKIEPVIASVEINVIADRLDLWINVGSVTGIISVMIVGNSGFALIAVEHTIIIHKGNTEHAGVLNGMLTKRCENALQHVASR
jgi:hypothetical protein